MKVLILNAGSSSLKYQLLDMDNGNLLAKGLVERIGIEGSHIQQKVDGKVFDAVAPMKTHTEGIQWMLTALTDAEKGAVKSMDEITAVGHRVLHGGERFTGSVLVSEAVKDAIRENIPLGPLHNPANLMGIEACEKVMPGTPKALPSTTLAVFLPTPANSTSSSIVLGTWPPCFSSNELAMARIDLALLRKNPVGWISFSSSSWLTVA